MIGQRLPGPSARPIDLHEAASLYQHHDWTLRDLAQHYGMSYSAIRSLFLRYGIALRSRSEAIALARRRHPRQFDFRGDKNPAWKGGRSKDSRGYITISSLRWKREHRVVAEAMLGRPLLPHEVVHHLNGRKDDNRPVNLQVLSRTDHSRLHACQHDDTIGGHRAHGHVPNSNHGR